ncbi:MAG: hypothetical protein JO037_09045 [Actinobacteria bacterium]|nr:hypothetical protein [Actinomycetota bacterium]
MTPFAAPAGDGGLIPARPLAAQVHALRAAAALIEQAGIAGLSLTIGTGPVSIQVPAGLGGPAARAAAVARLAAATGARAVRDTTPGPTFGWVFARGQLAGHPAGIYTPGREMP